MINVTRTGGLAETLLDGPMARDPALRAICTVTSPGTCAGRRHLVEQRAVHHGALAAEGGRVQLDDAVEPDLARSALRVPGPGPDVEPDASAASLGGGVAGVVLARQHQAEHRGTVAGDDEHGPVLALRGVLLVRHPAPDDLAGVGVSVAAR